MKLFVDLHIHSCLSPCGDALMTPNNIVGMSHLKGLDAIAVCDHNTMGNLKAIKEVADLMGMCFLPGIEVTTREEVHVLCYFPDLERALPFGKEIYKRLPKILNRKEYFGEQLLLDSQDEVVGEEDRLLISAADISFKECEKLCHSFQGLFVPAHISRGANGVLNALGFLPEDVSYDAFEINQQGTILPQKYENKTRLRSSDAHYLENISEKDFYLNCSDKSIFGLYNRIKEEVQ